MSLYQLTIEEGTAFGDRHRSGKLLGLPDENLGADLFEATQEICEKAGLSSYEISNHAIAGEESRHNLVYWRYGDYVGVGPGAHGRVTLPDGRYAVANVRNPLLWLAASQAGDDSAFEAVQLPLSEQADEYLLMCLRLREGVSLPRYAALSGKPMDPSAINTLARHDLLWRDGTRIGATARGRPVLNGILRALA